MLLIAAFAVSVFIVTPLCKAQESSLSISPLVDTLNAQLLRQPDDPAVRRKLIDAYTLAFHPELALLEILDPFAGGKAAAADAGVKGRVQFSLEQIGPAIRSLQQSYLESPSDETLVLVAVLDYANKNPDKGLFELRRLKNRMPAVSVELLRIYEQFYLNNRKVIASAAGEALRHSDPVAYGIYFPKPQISILSPADYFATEAKQTSVIWEITHTRPLRTVRIGNETVFERSDDPVTNSTESVRKSYTHLATLHEGPNVIVVEAADVFGVTSVDTVVVNGLSFDRVPTWSSPEVDSLRFAIQFLRNYVPDSVFTGERRQGRRALLIAGAGAADSALYANRALFWHEYLINPVSGMVSPDQIKILIGSRVEDQNIAVVMDDWLLKGATFQSISFVYLAGEWRFTAREWFLKDRLGQWTDVRPRLEKLRNLASAGVVIVFEGSIDQRTAFEESLSSFVAESAAPLKVLVLPENTLWTDQLVDRSIRPANVMVSDSLSPLLTTADLAAMGALVLPLSGNDMTIAKKPAARILLRHRELLKSLEGKLARGKVAGGPRGKILNFSQDWRRYNEITRYLNDQLSIPDFLIRVEEYQSRTAEKP
ncbi:MAG: hypothetical protein WEF53_01465 [Bacteroidota bacterium]